jgi:hypothetical protein
MRPELPPAEYLSRRERRIYSNEQTNHQKRLSASARRTTAFVSIKHDWRFPKQEGPDFGIWESNANLLIDSVSSYRLMISAFGTYYQLRGLLCRVDKEKRT